MAAESTPETLFYDGRCGFCHRAVRFAAWADREGQHFRFAPLGGATFRTLVPAERAEQLPDSLVLRRRDGALLLRSDALLHLLGRLGGAWAALGALLRLLPRALRDAVYDQVARRRRSLAGAAEDACPVLPEALRARFDP